MDDKQKIKTIKTYQDDEKTPLVGFSDSVFITKSILESAVMFLMTRVEFEKSEQTLVEGKTDYLVMLTAEHVSLTLAMLMGQLASTVYSAYLQLVDAPPEPTEENGMVRRELESTVLFDAIDFYSTLRKLANGEIHRTDVDFEELAAQFNVHVMHRISSKRQEPKEE